MISSPFYLLAVYQEIHEAADHISCGNMRSKVIRFLVRSHKISHLRTRELKKFHPPEYFFRRLYVVKTA